VGTGVEVMRLIEELRLQPLTLASSPAAKNRYLLYKGALVKAPGSLTQALTSPLTRGAPLWLLRDLFAPRCGEPDESVHAFVSRRFGAHAAEVLVDAVMSGVHAGDIKALSAASTLSSLWGLEQQHRSVVLGMLVRALRGAAAAQPSPTAGASPLTGGVAAADGPGYHLTTALEGKGRGEGSHAASAAVAASARAQLAPDDSDFVRFCAGASSVSFVNGIETIVRALADQLAAPNIRPPGSSASSSAVEVQVLMRTRATALQRSAGTATAPEADAGHTGRHPRRAVRVMVHREAAEGGVGAGAATPSLVASSCVLDADYVVSALPASALAQVLPPDDAGFGPAIRAAAAIPYASVGVVNLGYRHQLASSPAAALNGFGYLCPARERAGVLGMTWDSSVFPGQHAEHAASLRGATATAPGAATASGAAAVARAGPQQVFKRPGQPEDVAPALRAGETRLTVMMGGAYAPDVADRSEGQLVEAALKAARNHVGITMTPTVTVAGVARAAIPQYNVGHRARVAAVEEGVAAGYSGRVLLVGNSYHGIGVADCIANALAVGERVAAAVGRLA
jgi:protoporphyrinogen oxidase